MFILQPFYPILQIIMVKIALMFNRNNHASTLWNFIKFEPLKSTRTHLSPPKKLLLYDYIKPKNEILALANNSKIEYS